MAALALACPVAYAQAPADADVPSLLAEVPGVPGLSQRLAGLNTGVTLLSVHDSASGWYTLVTPATTWAFARRYSADVSFPLYLYRLADESASTKTPPPPQGPGPGRPPQPTTTTTLLMPQYMEPGDTVLALHGTWGSQHAFYTLTPSMTMPSGDSEHGLSTGRVTFDVDNHFVAPVRAVNLLLDVGGGDSSTLFNRLVTKDYSSLGPLMHFQAGFGVALPWRGSFQAVAYEQLPIGDTKTYRTVVRRGVAQQVVTGRSASEDNGFTQSLTLPLTRHLSLLGYYNRSLRLHLDEAAVGLTFVARAPKGPRRMRSLVDEAARP